METLIDKYLRLVEGYKWSDLYNKWSFIATVAATLERRVWIQEHLLGYLYPSMYVVLVGPPASKKTSSARCPADQFLRNMEKGPVVASNQLTPAALIEELKTAAATRYETKAAPLFALVGEFSVFLGDIGGGSIIDVLLDFYDTRKPGEKWTKHTKKWGRQELPNPSLTMLAATTPQHIVNSRLLETAGLGFTRRIIFVTEPRVILGTKRFPEVNRELHAQIQKEFYRMFLLSGPYTLHTKAQDAIEGVFDRANAWLLAHPGSTLKSNYMSVKPVHVRKVALCLAAMRNSRCIIEADDILLAESMLDELEPTLTTAFGTQIIYRDPGLAFKIYDRIPIVGYISRSLLLESFLNDGQFLPADQELNNVFAGMVQNKQITVKQVDGEYHYARGPRETRRPN